MKKRGRLRKGLAMLLTAAMVVGLMPGAGTMQVSATESEASGNVATAEGYDANGFCTSYELTNGTWALKDSATACATHGDTCNGYQPATLTTGTHEVDGNNDTQDEVYEITNAGQLYWFADKINIENATYKNINAVLTKDITVNEGVLSDGKLNEEKVSTFRSWTPIGYYDSVAEIDYSFTGIFDGQGNTISGLYFSDSKKSYVGLFGESVGKIKRVNVNDSYYCGKDSVGAICGLIFNKGTIEDSNNINSFVSGTGKYVGGVCGRNYDGTITNCENTGNVSNVGYIGGICGANLGLVKNCRNSGNITGDDWVGGVCGSNSGSNGGKLETSYNTGDVKGVDYVGGVCGYQSGGSVDSCYNTGNVTGTSTDASVGGVCGYQSGLTNNCYSTGGVTCNAADTTVAYVGGVCGLQWGTIKNCYYDTGKFTGKAIHTSKTSSQTLYVEGKTPKQFSDGMVAYLLNSRSGEDSPVWYQNIDNGATPDTAPVLDSSHGTVYASLPCKKEFSNETKTVEHTFQGYRCTVCGELQPPQLNAAGAYEIKNANDLIWFAELVNGTLLVDRDPLADAVLVADITFEAEQNFTAIGSSSSPYSGTFDGAGFTVTVNQKGSDEVALFGCIGNCTIKNLTVTGTITTSEKYAAGIAMQVLNNTTATIEKCMSNVTIDSAIDGDGTHGGLVGVVDGTLNINNACFTGKMTGSTTNSCGGMVGYSSNRVTIKNSYVAADFSSIGSENGNTFARGNVTLVNCYYLNEMNATPSGAVLKTADEFANGYVTNLLNGRMSDGSLDWYQNIDNSCERDSYPVVDNTHGIVYSASQPCTCKFSNVLSEPEKIEHEFSNDVCTKCGKTKDAYDDVELIKPSQDSSGVYQIGSAGELYWFSALVNGKLTDGTRQNTNADAVLTNNITVNTQLLNDNLTLINSVESYKRWAPIGNESSQYIGTFDGKGYTISGLYNKNAGSYNGLFGYISSAMIKNVNIIDSYFYDYEDKYMGILCGYSTMSTIENVLVKKSYVYGRDYIGGVCGRGSETINNVGILNCSIKGAGFCGDIVGYSMYATISNSFTTSSSCVCGWNNYGTITNCYYLAEADDQNGGKASTQFASGEVAYLLNGGKSGDDVVWRQNLGEANGDATPVLDSSHGIVYLGEPCQVYTNASHKEHTYVISEDGKSHTCSDCDTTEQHADVATFTVDDENHSITATCPGGCELGTIKLSASDAAYDGTPKKAVIKGEIKGFDTPSVTYKQGDTPLASAPINAETYTASITLGTGEGAATLSVEYAIEKAVPELGTVSVAALSDTLDEAKAAFSRTSEAVAGTFALKDGTELQYGIHDYTYIFTPTGDDAVNYKPVTGTVSITVNDTLCPDVIVKVKDTAWKSVLNVLTFGHFFKAAKNIDVEAFDSGTGVASTWYYVSDNLLSEEAVKALEDSQWKSYDSSNKPSLSKGTCYVYVKVTDNSDNTTYVGTDGIVIYEDSTAVSTDIAYTYKENADKSVTLTLNGNTVEAIKDKAGNVLVADTDYTVEEDGTLTFKASYLDTLNASATAYPFTVSYNPQGKEYAENKDENGKDLNEAPDTTVIHVLVSKAEGSVTDISDLSKTYDGTAVSAPTFKSTNDTTTSNVTIEYKAASDEASAYDTTAPKNAGEYMVRVTVKADENYKAAFAEKTFTISPKSIEGADITLGESLTFIGEEQTQKVGSVKVGNDENQLTLTASDYEVTEATQTNAGNYTLTVTGKGNFTGSATKDFSIAKAKAPAITAVKKNYCYTAGSAGNTVTVNINALLPADKGDTNYILAENDASYVTDKAVSTDGKLTYKVSTQESSGASTTLIVTATSSNYENITVNVIIGIVDKLVPAEKEDAKVAIVGSNVLAYGQKLSTLTLNKDVAVFVEDNDTTKTISGILDWTTPEAVLDAGTTEAEWTFTPSDTTIYETLTGKLAIKVNKAEPNVTVLPTVAERTYHPNAKLADTDLILTEATVLDVNGVALSGTWKWKTADVIPTVENSGYDAVFTPADTDNYKTISKTITVNVTKATPYIETAPTAVAITYGKTLAAATLTGGSVQYSSEDDTAVDGTFAWKLDTTKPAFADSNTTAYTVVFTPTNENYNTVETDITVTVNKADAAPNKPNNTMEVDYGKKKVSDITTLPEGWAWKDADKDTALTVETAVKATAVYTGADKGNYETESVEISITRQECTHATTEVKNAKDATCTGKGYSGDTYCKVCGEKVKTGQDIDALGHSFAAEFTVDKEATCKEAGSKSRHCTRCEEMTDVTVIDKLTTHNYVNGVCSVCDDIFKTTVNGVTYQVMTETGADGKPVGKLVTVSGNEIPQVAVAVTGTGDDFTEKNPDGKVTVPSEITGSGSEQTFVVTKISDNAFSGASVTEVVVPATVAEVGIGAFGGATTITFKGNTAPSGIAGAITETVTTVNVPEGAADSYREALGENANIVEVHTHTFDTKWTYDDTYHWHASTCGHAEEVSDKAVHTFGEWTVTKEATEDAEGVKERSCTCGYKETAKIDKLSHTIHAKDEGTRVEPTCEKKGSITYKCIKCGETMEVVELDATGHKWDAGKVTKEATETAEGVKTYTCSVCGKTKTEAIPKKDAATPQPPKKGDVVKDDKTSVKVEVTDVKKKEVEYKEPANKKAKTVSIPATVKIDGVTYKVTKIDDNAFKGNKTVTKVTVGSNIKTIGKNAFSGATKLKTVKIGKNVTEVGTNAFKGCSSLTSVTLPSKTTKIGANAFNGCKKLKTIKITSTKLTSKTVAKNAFKGLTKATTIKVPKKKLSAYKKLFKQKGLSSKVKVKGY